MGRPQEYDRIKIGQDMVNWAATNPDALTVPMFAVSIGLHSGILRNWSRETEEFRVLFMQAKELIGINRLKASQNETLDSSIYRGHIGNYDIDINEYMREEKTFDSSLRKDEDGAKQSTYTIMVPHDLAIGANIPTSTISIKDNRSSK